MPTPPDHRASRIIGLAEKQADFDGDNPIERDFFYLVKKGEATLPEVRAAADIYQEPEFRHPFNALLIGRAPDSLIVDALKCDPLVLSPYRHLFFDATVFRHTPAIFRYIRELPLDDNDDTERVWREYYMVAAAQGPEYLANRFRVGERPDADPRKVIKTVVTDTYDRFLAHRGKQLNTEVAKEALKWGNAAVSAAVTLIEKGGDTKKNAVEELRVALQTNDLTKTPEQAGVDPAEVLS